MKAVTLSIFFKDRIGDVEAFVLINWDANSQDGESSKCSAFLKCQAFAISFQSEKKQASIFYWILHFFDHLNYVINELDAVGKRLEFMSVIGFCIYINFNTSTK